MNGWGCTRQLVSTSEGELHVSMIKKKKKKNASWMFQRSKVSLAGLLAYNDF